MRYRKFLYITAVLVAGGLVILIGLDARAHRTPLRVGATADEAWTYIHSPPAWGSEGLLVGVKRYGWKAHPYNIQCSVRYYFHRGTDRFVFATRDVTYLLGTNGTIDTVTSKWKWSWPF